MERKNIAKYLRTVDFDVRFVDEAIKRGAYLSIEEWHDFVFKSCVAGFKSDNLAKYHVVHGKASEVAKTGSYILECIVNAQVYGFTVAKARRWVKSIVKRFNKMLTPIEKMSFSNSDIDGVVRFVVESCDYGNVAESYIDSRDSLCDFLHNLWMVGVKELRIFNDDTVSFLDNHLYAQLDTIETGEMPSPYYGGVVSNTLKCVISERTDYENARKAAPAEQKKSNKAGKPVIHLKVSG